MERRRGGERKGDEQERRGREREDRTEGGGEGEKMKLGQVKPYTLFTARIYIIYRLNKLKLTNKQSTVHGGMIELSQIFHSVNSAN